MPNKPTGRPPICTEELTDLICQKIAEGGNLNKICEEDDMPSRESVYRWLRENSSFSDKYSRARVARADARSDRMDAYTARMIAGELDANVVRVALINEQWQAGRESPRKYGDKIQVAGDADGAPLVIAWAGDKG